MEFRYYLYRHIRLDNGNPFYIGIGTKPKKFTTYTEEYRRAFKKCGRKLLWQRVALKAGYEVEIMFESNNYNALKESEKFFISLYGRKDLGQGELVNHTDGGEGVQGRIWKPTESHIQKVIESNKRRKITAEHLQKLNEGRRNTPTSNESREKYSKAGLGRKHSEESKLKNSLAHKGSKHPQAKKVIDTETGKVFNCIKDAAEYFGKNYNRLSRNMKERPHRTTLKYL